MPKIDTIRLRALDPEAQYRFYIDVLGMRRFPDGGVGYSDAEAKIIFEPANAPYQASDSNIYWKFTIAVPDLRLAHTQLRANGVDATDPYQFEDIGYMAHFNDPEGFQIELLDHVFKAQSVPGTNGSHLFGGGAHLNLLTLRTHDIDQVGAEMRKIGMSPLAIMPVKVRGFVLHFYAFTNEAPPNDDLYAVENRPWLYQRPYTVLEVQHRDQTASMVKTDQDEAGYAGTLISGLNVRSFHYEPLLLETR